ncbi:hypothetical protein CIG75_12175 [Tumebacillus algifaecis]|uniref:DUF304 domain-containing protein n=1 Tax=Tumebacillus algifaecis TaxID=1214604 RepID=A0A223D2B8_9BACL|nr:hypothetical protein [Tumebacillus algifaecis]ASS75671.1 hypothetical protein CIG75_12175 [Tumebacillus algifaecis]
MKFVGERNWMFITIAAVSPYIWINNALQKTEPLTVSIAAGFSVLAVMLLVFLLRKQYIEVGHNTIELQSMFKRRQFSSSDIQKVVIEEQVILAYDNKGKPQQLMVPLKKEQVKELKEAVRAFCKRNRIPFQ